MTTNNPTEVLVKLVELLQSLSSEERHRAVSAAMTYLGDSSLERKHTAGYEAEETDASNGLNQRAKNWIKQNNLTPDAVNEVFHLVDGHAEIIASDVPGTGSKGKTLNVYVLTGIARFLETGTPAFDDKSARENCANLGCFNQANHAAYLSSKGNEISGSKDNGWTLTAPGLKHGASLISEIAGKRT